MNLFSYKNDRCTLPIKLCDFSFLNKTASAYCTDKANTEVAYYIRP